jgi:membrane-associated protein
MEIINFFIDFILHMDVHLKEIITDYGLWTYAILFVVIFIETGLVVTPFLPGDSLLFAAGSFAALGALNPVYLFLLLAFAALLGDTVNYSIGHYIGPRAFSGEIKFLKQEHLVRTQEFYEKHGGTTIILARFIPIIRTFAPVVAGAASMGYRRFVAYNVFGGIGWVTGMSLLGYYLGQIGWVKANLEKAVIIVILLSISPMFIHYFMDRRRKAARARSEGSC